MEGIMCPIYNKCDKFKLRKLSCDHSSARHLQCSLPNVLPPSITDCRRIRGDTVKLLVFAENIDIETWNFETTGIRISE